MAHAGGNSCKAALLGERPRRHRFPRDLARHRAVLTRSLPDHVCQPALDCQAICGILNGGGFQRVLPPQPRRRPEGSFGRVRSRHPSRLRQRSPARLRRRRHGRRRDRFDLRHAHPVRRHPARQDERVDDHERRGAADPGPLHRGRRGTGRQPRPAVGHDPERHPQGVPGPKHLHLSAITFDADHFGYLFIHFARDAEVQLDLDLRLSHPGSRGDA
ncbi:hypothetical protein GALL_491720 [mine drainage metagenome]|uniref:Uncharacterized protein n=1 Tax=mine drainage metagenome TaxID=410659 RepID=A0A1J5PNR7_9ZZZZ